MNDSVFNSRMNPLYTIDNLQDGYLNAVRGGTAYITTARSSALLALNNYLGLGITNPSGSGTNIFINSIAVVASGINLTGQVIIAKGATTLSNNADPTTFSNANLALSTTQAKASIKMSEQGSSPGGTVIEVGSQINSVYESVYNGGLLVAPNTKLTVYIQNTLGVTVAMYIKITFWEETIS